MQTSRVVFSEHAVQQLNERGLTRAAVVDTLRRPDSVVDGYAGCRIAQRVIRQGGGEWLLRVVYADVRDRRVVVTVYRTSKVAKYLRGA